jgi:hypothetical protein
MPRRLQEVRLPGFLDSRHVKMANHSRMDVAASFFFFFTFVPSSCGRRQLYVLPLLLNGPVGKYTFRTARNVTGFRHMDMTRVALYLQFDASDRPHLISTASFKLYNLFRQQTGGRVGGGLVGLIVM